MGGTIASDSGDWTPTPNKATIEVEYRGSYINPSPQPVTSYEVPATAPPQPKGATTHGGRVTHG